MDIIEKRKKYYIDNRDKLLEKSKEYYNNNKTTVIERVRRYQAKVQDLEQLERLYELQQQGLIHVQTGELTQEQYDKYNNRLINRLAHLHLSS